MAQGRFLNKTISLSEKFALLPNDTTRLIATWCIPHLDKNGVTYGDARKIRALVVPMLDLTTSQVNEAIAAMNDFGLIRLFNVNGEMWMHWPGFSGNQTMSALARERTSFPEPPIDQPQPQQPAQSDDMQLHANASDKQTLSNDEQAITCNYMQMQEVASNSMLKRKESKLSESKLNEEIGDESQKSPAKISNSSPALKNPPVVSKSKADSRSSHPAILAIKQVTNRMPPIVTYDLIIKAIGSEPDAQKLAQCFTQWSARGFNPQNISGVLDWYLSGIPEPRKQSAPLFKPKSYRRPQVESTDADRAVLEKEINNVMTTKHAANLANPTAHIAKLTQRIQTAQRVNTTDAQQYIARIQAKLAEFKAQLADYQQVEVTA